MAGRPERYETKDQMEELGGLSDRLAVDLRRVCKLLRPCLGAKIHHYLETGYV